MARVYSATGTALAAAAAGDQDLGAGQGVADAGVVEVGDHRVRGDGHALPELGERLRREDLRDVLRGHREQRLGTLGQRSGPPFGRQVKHAENAL
jgi:hypothetical protein